MSTMKKQQIEAVFERFTAWLNEDKTWEQDLDGYSGIDLATIAASKFKSMLVEECEPKAREHPTLFAPSSDELGGEFGFSPQ